MRPRDAHGTKIEVEPARGPRVRRQRALQQLQPRPPQVVAAAPHREPARDQPLQRNRGRDRQRRPDLVQQVGDGPGGSAALLHQRQRGFERRQRVVEAQRLGLAERERAEHARPRLRVVLADQLERPLQQRDRVRRGERRTRPLGRDERVLDAALGAGQGRRGVVVPRQIGGDGRRVVGVHGLQRAGDAAVQPRAAARAEAPVERVADEVVREVVALGADRPHEVGGERLLDAAQQRVLVQLGHRLQLVEAEAAAEDGRDVEHVARLGRQRREPQPDRAEHRLRHAPLLHVARPHAPVAVQVAPQLGEEERVAGALGVDRRAQVRLDGAAGGALEQRRRVVVVQPREQHVVARAVALHLAERLRERVGEVERLAAVGRQQARPGREAGHVHEQVERCRVREMDVVEHDQRRAVEAVEQAHDRLVQAQATLVGRQRRRRRQVGQRVADRRQEVGEHRGVRAEQLAQPLRAEAVELAAEQLDPGAVGLGRAALVAGAPQHPRAPLDHPARDLRDRAGLADPGLPVHDHDGAGRRPVEGVGDRRELGLTADELPCGACRTRSFPSER